MDDSHYLIFEPKKQRNVISNNLIVLIATTSAVFIFWIADGFFSVDLYKDIKLFSLSCLVILWIYWLIAGFFTYRPLNGEFTGNITFKADSFIINEKVIQLKNLKRLNIHAEDYYGLHVPGPRVDFNPRLSQGINNYIEFTDLNNLTEKVFFKQTVKDQYLDLSEFIVFGVTIGIIPFLRGIELLRITDYDEIQQFKKSVAAKDFQNV
jgi:hypothetical protein